VPSILQRFFKRAGCSPAARSPNGEAIAGATVPTSAPHPSDATLPNLFDSVCAEAAARVGAADFEQAILLYDRAIELQPSRAEPYYKRANAFKALGRLEAALTSYDQAVEREPGYAHAHCNRGVVQQALGLAENALASYDRAIALDPADVVAHYNRAVLMQDRSCWQEALASYDRAISIDPRFADAQYNRSMLQLFLGDFESGWRGYEWRWANAKRLGIGAARTFVETRWHGQEPIDGKRLLLYGEAGLGDTLHFCRYATLCARLGATVILEVQAPLCGLLQHLEGISKVVSAGNPLPPFDYQCPLLSLPLAFKTTLDTIPAPRSYLRAEVEKVMQWRIRLGPRRRPRVGLAWSGNPRNAIDARRSIRLADWLPSLPPELEYFCLQTSVSEADAATLGSSSRVISFDSTLLDFENTAALCQCMDIVVTVDTSLAHLAGALGHRTWVLLPKVPDFRWLQDRDDSPWYPSLKLYRQSAAGDWSGVFDRRRFAPRAALDETLMLDDARHEDER
jgi:tetratricopeptide (TPR) repeat protein